MDRAKYDSTTAAWFRKNPGMETTIGQCKECGLFYKPILGHKCKAKRRCKPQE